MKRTWITILIIIIIAILGYWIWSAHNSSMGGEYAPAASDQSAAPMIPATGTSTTYGISDTSSTSAAPMLTIANDPTLGAYLVATNGMTVYTYAPDATNKSNCTGGCATAWPPYAVTGTLAAGSGVNKALATYTRADGSTQITYNGRPLYFYSKDMNPGDTNGQGIGGVWYVVKP